MTKPTWTPWNINPGTGECPVPKWAEKYEVCLDNGTKCKYMDGPEKRNWNTPLPVGSITCYRYQVPADLAQAAKENRKRWATIPGTIFTSWDPKAIAKTRQDMGYEKQGRYVPGKAKYPPDTPPNFRCIKQPEIKEDDPVHHPNHYMLAPELEAIDVIRASLTPTEYMGYLKGSILKYRLRAGRKGEAEQDIAKSDWYRHRAVELERANELEGGA